MIKMELFKLSLRGYLRDIFVEYTVWTFFEGSLRVAPSEKQRLHRTRSTHV